MTLLKSAWEGIHFVFTGGGEPGVLIAGENPAEQLPWWLLPIVGVSKKFFTALIFGDILLKPITRKRGVVGQVVGEVLKAVFFSFAALTFLKDLRVIIAALVAGPWSTFWQTLVVTYAMSSNVASLVALQGDIRMRNKLSDESLADSNWVLLGTVVPVAGYGWITNENWHDWLPLAYVRQSLPTAKTYADERLAIGWVHTAYLYFLSATYALPLVLLAWFNVIGLVRYIGMLVWYSLCAVAVAVTWLLGWLGVDRSMLIWYSLSAVAAAMAWLLGWLGYDRSIPIWYSLSAVVAAVTWLLGWLGVDLLEYPPLTLLTFWPIGYISVVILLSGLASWLFLETFASEAIARTKTAFNIKIDNDASDLANTWYNEFMIIVSYPVWTQLFALISLRMLAGDPQPVAHTVAPRQLAGYVGGVSESFADFADDCAPLARSAASCVMTNVTADACMPSMLFNVAGDCVSLSGQLLEVLDFFWRLI